LDGLKTRSLKYFEARDWKQRLPRERRGQLTLRFMGVDCSPKVSNTTPSAILAHLVAHRPPNNHRAMAAKNIPKSLEALKLEAETIMAQGRILRARAAELSRQAKELTRQSRAGRERLREIRKSVTESRKSTPHPE
jgi:hypothetical protein